MSLTSLTFAQFVLLTLLLYHALPRVFTQERLARRAQNALLLVASYAFILTWAWLYALVLAAGTLANFLLLPHLRREGRPHWRIVWLGVGLNLLALAVFKYESFFVPDLREALDAWGMETGIGGLDALLPVGMSFYILAAISTLVDVARGLLSPPRDPLDFALYMAYFPKLLAGPIERARAFLPRLAAPCTVDRAVVERSLALIALGVARKIVLADTLFRTLPPHLWNTPGSFTATELWPYLFIYGLALYNDFAGYTCAARGVSGLFGLELSRNFDLPYVARTASEFWNRWHITLSQWLRDYVFYPTSRALLRRDPRAGNIPNLLLPPMLTMLVSGVWHGTGLTFVLWGALHGLYLVGERALALRWPAGPPRQISRWRHWLSMAITLALVMLAWVPFRVSRIDLAWEFWAQMVTFDTLRRPSVRVVIVILPALLLDWVQYVTGDELVFLRWPRLVQAALLALLALVAFVLSLAVTGTPFVYQGY